MEKSMTISKPLFIVVEGIDGVGKTTVVGILHKVLNDRDIKNVPGKGLGSTKISSIIREELLSGKKDDQYEVLGMLFSLLDCYRNFIQPSIENGVSVVLDRYIASYYAYQAHGRNSIRAKNYLLDTFYGKHIQPDVFINVTASPEITAERLDKRETDINHFDLEVDSFKSRVLKGFDEFLQTNEVYTHIYKKIPVVNIVNNGSIEDLETQLTEIVKGLTQ